MAALVSASCRSIACGVVVVVGAVVSGVSWRLRFLCVWVWSRSGLGRGDLRGVGGCDGMCF